MSGGPVAQVTLMIDGHIREAECSVCRDRIGIWTTPKAAEDELLELNEAFERHRRLRHPDIAS